MRHAMPCLALLCLLSATAAAGDDCRYTEDRDEVVEVGGARSLSVRAAAGSLVIEGRSGLAEIRVRGVACASHRSYLEEIGLRVERRGETVRIETEMPEEMGGWLHQARLDLTIEVPDTLALEVADGSGSIRIEKVESVDLTDGSGSIEIRQVAGSLSIRDGSGEIDVRTVGGAVEITDGSGSIDVRDVGGDVTLRDGSGSMTIADVRGSVRVRSDGSGSIRVSGVSGDFVVDNDGSGGISFDRVAGRVSVP